MNVMDGDLERLVATAQRNCDVADAHHAQGMPLCAYLLDLREYYRWQRGFALDAALERAPLSAWIAGREALWDELRAQPETAYAALDDGQECDDPFDEVAANAALAGRGLIYGAGIGRFGRPLFFLAERSWIERREGIDILVAGRELARGLTAPPAVSRDGHVLIRLDALERWLWTRVEEWRHHPHDSGFAAAWAMHAGKHGESPATTGDPVAVVKRMALAEVETLVLHEIGEQRVGRTLGDDWEDMLETPGNRKAEMFARSLRDLYADCEVTLPTLLERGAEASIHFWFGNLDGMRRVLAPALHEAYRAWCGGEPRRLLEAVAQGRTHWRYACSALLGLWAEGGGAALDAAAQTPEAFMQKPDL